MVGILLLIIAIGGILAAIAGAVIGLSFIGQTAASLTEAATSEPELLNTVRATLVQAQGALSSLVSGLDTMSQVIAGAAEALDTAGTMLEEFSAVSDTGIPQALDEVKSIVGEVGKAAQKLEELLDKLSTFSFGLLDLDAGDDIAIAQPISQLHDTLSTLSGDVQGIEGDLKVIAGQLKPASRDLLVLSEDVSKLSADLAGFAPILDRYIEVIDGLRGSTGQAVEAVERLKSASQTILVVAMAWIALTHLTPLYLGWELVSGKRTRAPKPQ